MTDDYDGPPETAASNGVKQQSSSVSHGGDVSDSGFGIPRGNVWISNIWIVTMNPVQNAQIHVFNRVTKLEQTNR